MLLHIIASLLGLDRSDSEKSLQKDRADYDRWVAAEEDAEEDD